MRIVKSNENILSTPLNIEEPKISFRDLDDEVFSDIGEISGLDDKFTLDEPIDTPVPETAKLGVPSAVASQLNALIIDEFEAIQGYNSTIVSLQEEPECENIIKVLKDIVYEENVHVGQLQKLLQTVSPNARGINKGADEAEEQILSSEQVPMTFIDADDSFDDKIDFSKAEDIKAGITPLASDVAHPFMKVESVKVNIPPRKFDEEDNNKQSDDLSLESECEILDADDEM